jgi:hypothetical protein
MRRHARRANMIAAFQTITRRTAGTISAERKASRGVTFGSVLKRIRGDLLL